MEHIKLKLRAKGWSRKEIDHATKIIAHAQAHRHPYIQKLDAMMFWCALGVAVVGNMIVALAMVPLYVLFPTPWMYLIVAIMGFSFGLLFELLIRTIEHLEVHHHIFLGIMVPFIGLLTIGALVGISNSMETAIALQTYQHPMGIALLYIAAYMIPYTVHPILVRRRMLKYI